jgi:hypothetical protein
MGRALAHEFSTRIGDFQHWAQLNLLDRNLGLNLDLSLRRTGQDEKGDNRCGTDTWDHGGLTGCFLGSSCALAGGKDDGLGSGQGRRTAICEGADTRQPRLRRAGHRRTSQNEAEGKDEAEGSHLTVSGFGLPSLSRRFVAGIDSQPVFPDVCAKSRKWFHRRRELFRRRQLDETIRRKSQ